MVGMKAPWWSTSRGDLVVAGLYTAFILLAGAAGLGGKELSLELARSWGWGEGTTALAWLGAAASLIGVIGVAVRHRSVRAALALMIVGLLAATVLGFSLGALLLVFELLFTSYLLGGRRGPAVARGLASGLSAALIIGVIVAGGSLGDVLTSCIVAVAVLWLPVLWAADLRLADRLRGAERERADQEAQTAAARAQLAVASERTRMAGELHDTVSGHLSAIALQAQAAALTRDPERRDATLEQIRSGSVAALEQMRELIGVLQAGEPQPEMVGSLADIVALAERARAAGVRVQVLDGAAAGFGAGVDPAVEAAAYRVLSEGVTNALKHAPGAALTLSTRMDGATLAVQVRNDAAHESRGTSGSLDAATDPPAAALRGHRRENGPAPSLGPGLGNGLGLAQLRSRVDHVGGSLTAGATPEGGWLLSARFPLNGRSTL